MELEGAPIVEELTPAYEKGQTHTDPLEYIEVLRDRGAINERFAEIQRSVKREILVFTKPPYATPPQENVEGLEVTQSHVARSVYEVVRVRRPGDDRGRPPVRRGGRGRALRPASCRSSS